MGLNIFLRILNKPAWIDVLRALNASAKNSWATKLGGAQAFPCFVASCGYTKVYVGGRIPGRTVVGSGFHLVVVLEDERGTLMEVHCTLAALRDA